MTVKNQAAANAIAEAMSNGFTHPGGDKRQAVNLYLPGLDLRGKPTHMVEAIKGITQAIGEAIVHLIESDLDSTITPNTELRELRAAVQVVDVPR